MNLPKFGNNRPVSASGVSWVWVLVAGVIIVVGGYLISTVTPYLFPPQGSAQAVLIDDLFRFMLFVGGAIFILVEGLLLISVIRYRARKGERADGPPIQGNTTLEFVWTLIPAIIVAILSLYAFVVWQQIETPAANAQQVGAVGQRFAWTFTYSFDNNMLPPETDTTRVDAGVLTRLSEGSSISFSSPQLHTWVNQPVTVSMETDDVNHAFWIPGMRLKQDLLAGRVTTVSFTPIEAGVYRIVCAELCGSGHGQMAGVVTESGDLSGAWLIVHPDEATYLDQFYYPEVEKILYPPTDPVALGRQVIQNYACAGCHRLDDLGWAGVTGPNLNGVASRTARLQATGIATMDEYLHHSIRHPADYLVPGYGNLMPQFNPEPDQPNYMPDSDLDAIVAYLLTQTGS
jgi:cytochrome c oxidase subunit 2